MDNEKELDVMWILTAIIVAVLCVCSWALPDFIPFADEILLTLGTVLSTVKAVTPKKKKKKKNNDDDDIIEVDDN